MRRRRVPFRELNSGAEDHQVRPEQTSLRLLPGRSASEWDRRRLKWIPVEAVAFLTVSSQIQANAGRPIGDVLFAAFFVLLAADAGYGLWLSKQKVARRRQEEDAGYTTTRPWHDDLWVLDPATGRVVRPPLGWVPVSEAADDRAPTEPEASPPA